MYNRQSPSQAQPGQARRGPPRVAPGKQPTRLIWIAVAGLALLMIGSLALIATWQPGRRATTVTVAEADSGGQVALQVGDTLEIALESNPTTGYRWSLLALDTAVLQPLGEAQYTPAGSELGSGGTETFRFTAVRAGQVELSLGYSRPFEPDAAPLRGFVLSVQVAAP